MTLLVDVVAASRDLAATSSRTSKVAILSDLLGRLEASEIAVAVAFLTGVPRQGRVGVGHSTAYGIRPASAQEASVTIDELDRTIATVQARTGDGSASERRRVLGELLERATDQEADFIRRLFTGDLRQGALAGLMADATAKAAGVPVALVRRALMLAGDLPRTAEIAITGGEEGLRA